MCVCECVCVRIFHDEYMSVQSACHQSANVSSLFQKPKGVLLLIISLKKIHSPESHLNMEIRRKRDDHRLESCVHLPPTPKSEPSDNI